MSGNGHVRVGSGVSTSTRFLVIMLDGIPLSTIPRMSPSVSLACAFPLPVAIRSLSPRLLHSRILENIIRKKGVSGASSAQSPTHLVYHLHSFRYIAAVEKLIFRDFLSRFDAQGQFPCSCGLTHGISVRNVVVEAGALARGASLLADEMGSKAAVWVLSDENTERAAGAEWKKRLSSPRIVSHVLPGNPGRFQAPSLPPSLPGKSGQPPRTSLYPWAAV